MNVLVICEDFRNDQYIAKPMVEALMTSAGYKNSRVQVCRDPNFTGVDQVLAWDNLQEILEMYGTVELFLLIVDRDGNPNRKAALQKLEQKAAAFLCGRARFLAENAWQEIEAWALAGFHLPNPWRWKDVRDEPNSKEQYFEPFARLKGLSDDPGGGRKALGIDAARKYRTRVRKLCRELNELEARVAA